MLFVRFGGIDFWVFCIYYHVTCEERQFFFVSHLCTFCFLIALVKISKMKLNRNDERGHLSLLLILEGKCSGFLPLSLVIAVGFYRCSSLSLSRIKLRKFLSIPSLLRDFIINEDCLLSDTSSTSYWCNYVIFLFCLLI